MGLTALPSTIGGLVALDFLRLSGCSNLTTLMPDEIGELRSLKDLMLDDCARLTALPASFTKLVQLEELNTKGSPHLAALPDLSAMPRLNVTTGEAPSGERTPSHPQCARKNETSLRVRAARPFPPPWYLGHTPPARAARGLVETRFLHCMLTCCATASRAV